MKNTATKKIRVSEKQIAVILRAIAQVENWGGDHKSIESYGHGWVFMNTPAGRMPVPSADLLRTVKEIVA